MNKNLFTHIMGLIRRWSRKNFHKSWDVVKYGLNFFQEFADIYGDTINDIEMAEQFLKDFMEQTNGWVIVDFLDTDNWDCIRKVEVDKKNKLIWFYWQIPSGDPIEEKMRQMVFPLKYYGICLKFDNVRFVRDKYNRCIGIIINGYTIREKNVKGFAQYGGWEIKEFDAEDSFFSITLVRKKDDIFQQWRFMNTPISSFWIIPKCLNIYPHDSEKFLYMLGVEKCEKELEDAFEEIKVIDKLDREKQRKKIKAVAHDMRIVAESLFKLIMCFNQKDYQYKVSNYDDFKLGNLTKPLKNTIYKQDFEQERIDEIPRLANDLSHDSGNPVELKDLSILFMDIMYFINDFKMTIQRKGYEFIDTHSDGASPHDFVKEKYKSFCFIDDINKIVHRNSGKISFKIKAQVGIFTSIFDKCDGENVLCKDGYIRNSKEYGIEVLKI